MINWVCYRIKLGQHNFEFRSVSWIHESLGWGRPHFYFTFYNFCPILEGKSVEKSKSRWGRFHFTFKNRLEMWNGFHLGAITIWGRGISISWPCEFRWGRGTQISTQSCAGLNFTLGDIPAHSCLPLFSAAPSQLKQNDFCLRCGINLILIIHVCSLLQPVPHRWGITDHHLLTLNL